MELIKGGPGDLPVRLLVEVAQRHGVGEQQIELLGHFQAHGFFQFERQHVGNRAVALNFGGVLMKAWLRVDFVVIGGELFLLLRHACNLPVRD